MNFTALDKYNETNDANEKLYNSCGRVQKQILTNMREQIKQTSTSQSYSQIEGQRRYQIESTREGNVSETLNHMKFVLEYENRRNLRRKYVDRIFQQVLHHVIEEWNNKDTSLRREANVKWEDTGLLDQILRLRTIVDDTIKMKYDCIFFIASDEELGLLIEKVKVELKRQLEVSILDIYD